MVSSRRIPLERFISEDVSKDSSSDNAKGNALMVDSPLTDGKCDIENCDDPGSSSSKENLECYPHGAEKQLNHQKGVGNLSSVKTNRLYSTRYFIIKSLNHHNIELSIERGIWATQVMNEPILEEAFDNSSRVILIFSVNMSGCFQGYAQMMSSVGWRRDNVWSEASGGTIPWGRSFKVNWLQLHNLPFQKTLHLKNPLNDYKPVKISRDCQELTQDIGEALCGLIDESVDLDERLKRNNFYGDDLYLKRPYMDFPACLPDEEYVHNVPPPSQMGWGRTPVLHPSLSYQKVTQAEASDLHIPHGRSPGRYLPENIEGSKVSPMKLTHTHGYPTNVQRDRDSFFQPDNRNLSSKQGFVADTLSEDDFLEMTYEEYVEAIGRRNNSSHRTVVGPCWSMQEASTSREHEHDHDRIVVQIFLAGCHHSRRKNSSAPPNESRL